MIAKILAKSADFSAVTYNDEKVKEGVAELLEMRNMGYVEQMGASRTTEATRKYMKEYSDQNGRIKYPQFHVAISCKEKDYDKEELLDIAHQYLQKMGYDYTKMPTLIYFHHDTNNNHVHVITSRVNADDATKINHSFERCKSNKVISEIMDVNYNEEVKRDVDEALKYNYGSMGQFIGILESRGYEAYEDNEKLKVKKGGEVILSLDTSIIKDNFKVARDKERDKQIKALLQKFHEMSSNKDDLVKYMHDLFDIDLVFLGKKDSPYGYLLIDNKFKNVYKGGEIMKIKELLKFRSVAEKWKEILDIIGNNLKLNERITTKSLNSMLRRVGGRITKGMVKLNSFESDLPKEIAEKLKENDRLHFIQSFHPESSMQRDALVHIFKVAPSDIDVYERIKPSKEIYESVEQLSSIVKENGNELHNGLLSNQLREVLNNSNIILVKMDDDYVAIDMQRKCMFTLSDHDIKIYDGLNEDNQLKPQKRIQKTEQAALPQRQQQGKGGGVPARVGRINLDGGRASDSVNQNPDDYKKTNWSQAEGENGLKR